MDDVRRKAMRKTSAFVMGVCFVLVASFAPRVVLAQYDGLIGEEMNLKTPEERGVIMVAVDKEQFNIMIGNSMAEDKKSFNGQLYGHRIFRVEDNTKVWVLRTKFWENAAYVEIRDGTYKGRMGWVLLDYLTGY